jgi:hypothetical protein
MLNFLGDLVKFPLVDEIIIINNDSKNTPDDPILADEKIKMFDFGENIYVNPAWNFGVHTSKNDKVCILNDDMIFDIKLFFHLDDFPLEDTGVVGICPGHVEHNQPKFETGSIKIIPWAGQHTLGFGCLFFIHKSWWMDIPADLKVYYGDNWVFDTCLWKGKTNFIITDLLHHTPYAQTTGSIVNDFLNKETEIYSNATAAFKLSLTKENYLESEYEDFCNTPSNINEHLPVLNFYAKLCDTVTEFGVSDGCSTRAFLKENVQLRSYDIVYNKTVDDLFKIAQVQGKDMKYTIADVTKIEIEETDLLFIDSWHSYNQLKLELNLHAHKAKKYMIFHDTHAFGVQGEGGPGDIGLLPAIIEFIISNPQWKFKEHRINNNGLTVLEKV